MKVKKVLLVVLSAMLVFSCMMGVISVAAVSKAEWLSMEGAAIRTTGTQGLKFVGSIQKNDALQIGSNVNFGLLLIPQSVVGNGELITVETKNIKKVPAQNLLSKNDSSYQFSAVLTDIPVEFYGTDILARAYVEDNGTYSYSEQISRSVKTVAESILADAEATETDKTAARNVMTQYNLLGNDILVDAEDIWHADNQLIAYPEYPDQIKRDYMYDVNVKQRNNTESLVVYNQTEAFFYQDRFNGGDVNRRFCEFAFSGEAVTVNIKVNCDFDTYAVIPTSKGFASTYSNGVISVTLDEPEQFVVILDDDVNTALAVFADAPETSVPSKTDANTIYVEGWNEITFNNTGATLENGVLKMEKGNTQLYIAPGAVLTARVITTQDNNDASVSYGIKIFGRGAILDPFSLIYQYDPSTTDTKHLVKIGGYSTTVQDIKLLDARCFNLNMNRGTGTVQNVKILSTMMTSDGITTTANSGVVRNCFVYCGDNALVTQVGSGSTGYSFENITIGTTCSAIYPQFYSNSTFTDIYVFRADEGLVALKHGDGDAHQKYITINNLDALDCVKTPWLFHAQEQGSAEKIITMNKVLMRYTTGSSNIKDLPGTSTNDKTLFNATFLGIGVGSNFTLNMTDLYVGGTLITSDSQVKTSYLSATKNYASSGVTPAILAGRSFDADYICADKVMIGQRLVFLNTKPVYQNGNWYLPYDEIVAHLSTTAQTPVKTTIGGVEMILLSDLVASGVVTDAIYNDTEKVIQLTATINSSTNLLKENYNFSANYNPLYYKDKTAYLKADLENDEWVYTAASVSSQGGIVRMILDLYQQYGAGTYTVTFDYKASTSKITVGIGVDHTEAKYSQDVSGASSTTWKNGSVTFTITEDLSDVDQMALWFKVSNGNTISLKNIQLIKTN